MALFYVVMTGNRYFSLSALGPTLHANSLFRGQEKRTMRETEVQTANSGSGACGRLHREG
jgi:hypothetical protein